MKSDICFSVTWGRDRWRRIRNKINHKVTIVTASAFRAWVRVGEFPILFLSPHVCLKSSKIKVFLSVLLRPHHWSYA